MTESRKIHRTAALSSGWRQSELWWEDLQERAKVLQLSGDLHRAARYWRLGYWLGIFILPVHDPRFACSVANAAAVAHIRGRSQTADQQLTRARSLWSKVPRWVERITSNPAQGGTSFRSAVRSGFGETGEGNLKAQLLAHVRETEAKLLAGVLERPSGVCRWVADRSAVHDDTRRLKAACFLVAYGTPSIATETSSDGEVVAC